MNADLSVNLAYFASDTRPNCLRGPHGLSAVFVRLHTVGEGNSSNPLKQVLNAVGEKVECVTYDRVSIALQ